MTKRPTVADMLPGMFGEDRASLARRLAGAPLRPVVPQAPCDAGLFGDAAAQSDLVDLARERGPK
jgi:hypothetical protein